MNTVFRLWLSHALWHLAHVLYTFHTFTPLVKSFPQPQGDNTSKLPVYMLKQVMCVCVWGGGGGKMWYSIHNSHWQRTSYMDILRQQTAVYCTTQWAMNILLCILLANKDYNFNTIIWLSLWMFPWWGYMRERFAVTPCILSWESDEGALFRATITLTRKNIMV